MGASGEATLKIILGGSKPSSTNFKENVFKEFEFMNGGYVA